MNEFDTQRFKRAEDNLVGCFLFIIIGIPLSIILIIAIIYTIHFTNNAFCGAQYEAKRKAEWGFISGCTIIDDKGERIPEKRFRSGLN